MSSFIRPIRVAWFQVVARLHRILKQLPRQCQVFGVGGGTDSAKDKKGIREDNMLAIVHIMLNVHAHAHEIGNMWAIHTDLSANEWKQYLE